MNNTESLAQETNEPNGAVGPEDTRKGWVKFEDDITQRNSQSEKDQDALTSPAGPSNNVTLPSVPAILNTETVHMNLERGDKNVELEQQQSPFRKNVEFINVRQGFCK